jgi:hypothetical protein
MSENSEELRQFRTALEQIMPGTATRPFLCTGSPLACKVFIVGFNPATSLDGPFWRYWSDDSGYDKASMMRDYLIKRNLSEPIGVRARIERIVAQLQAGICLETNICSTPTKKAAQLVRDNRKTEIFEFLLRKIKPKLVYVHSNEPIKFFQKFTDKDFCSGIPQLVQWQEQEFLLLGTSGPLFRMGFPQATALGNKLAEHI